MRILFVIVLLSTSTTTSLADVTGPTRIIDGDTIVISGERIRLHGIDAPELKQTCKGKEQLCGQLAKQTLEKFVRGQEVVCKGDNCTHDRAFWRITDYRAI